MRSLITLFVAFVLVAASAQTNCDSLLIDEVRYAAFTDTIIEVIATNTSSHNFIYPGFILFNASGDTLAMEQVDYFDIAQNQVHRLRIKPGAVLPTGPFQATIELWNSFYTNLECSYSPIVTLCPPPPCSPIFPYIGNFGGALVTANYTWALNDSTQTTVDSGQFTLAGQQQDDLDSACIAAGSYTLTVTGPTQPTGGQLWFGVSSNGSMGGIQQSFLQASGPQSVSFDFFPVCTDFVDLVPEVHHQVLQFEQNGDLLSIIDRDGYPIGSLQLLDAAGRTVLNINPLSGMVQISTAHLAAGVHLIVIPDRSIHRRIVIR